MLIHGNGSDSEPPAVTDRIVPTPLLRLTDLAALFRVRPQTVYNWRATGTGPPAIQLVRLLRFDPVDINEWACQRLINAVPLSDFRLTAAPGFAGGFEHLMRVKDVTTYLDVPESTFGRWRTVKCGPPQVGRVGPVRFSPSALATWLDARKGYGRGSRGAK